MSSHASLSAAADDRKARLARLRSIKRKQPDGEVAPPESDRTSPALRPDDQAAPETDKPAEPAEPAEPEEPDVARLHLSGRNYDPELRGVKLGFEAPPNLAAGESTLEAKAAQLEAEIRRQQAEEDEQDEAGKGGVGDIGAGKGIDIFKLQPKKPNWDLKRELNKRLEPLNERTDRAIARLVRERLAAKDQQQSKPGSRGTDNADKGAAGVEGLEGSALVESLRIREQEEQEEERREREAEETE